MKRFVSILIILAVWAGPLSGEGPYETESRLPDTLDVVNGITWNNATNACTEDDSEADSTNFGVAGTYAGGNFANITQVPAADGVLTAFAVRHREINNEHANDTYLLQVYNPDTTVWETLETFNSANLLPDVLTTEDYTSAMATKYAAASNKTTFLNGLQFRLYCSVKTGGADGINWALAWAKFTYEYEESAVAPPPEWVVESEVILP